MSSIVLHIYEDASHNISACLHICDNLAVMNDNKNDSTRIIAQYLCDMAAKQDVSQVEVQKLISRSSGYVSERFSGVKSFTIPELDLIAKALNLVDAFELIENAKISSDSYRAMHVSDLGLAAKHGDTNGEQESYEAEP
jgi:hypothetical protein